MVGRMVGVWRWEVAGRLSGPGKQDKRAVGRVERERVPQVKEEGGEVCQAGEEMVGWA